jgi:uncharacterized membrane protein YbhN (UPF0104 family)
VPAGNAALPPGTVRAVEAVFTFVLQGKINGLTYGLSLMTLIFECFINCLTSIVVERCSQTARNDLIDVCCGI